MNISKWNHKIHIVHCDKQAYLDTGLHYYDCLPSRLSACLSVCPCCWSNKKTTWAINTIHGARILYSSRSACIDPEVKRSKVKVTRLRKPLRYTAASAHRRYSVHLYAAVLPVAVAGVGLHVDTTAYVF